MIETKDASTPLGLVHSCC